MHILIGLRTPYFFGWLIAFCWTVLNNDVISSLVIKYFETMLCLEETADVHFTMKGDSPIRFLADVNYVHLGQFQFSFNIELLYSIG